MAVKALVDKDWKPSGNHDDTFAQEGKLFCTTDAELWPCEKSDRGKEIASDKPADSEPADK